MKQFNHMKLQQIIKDHVIPTGSFYGYIRLKYVQKVPLKKYVVTDKDGYIVFNEDGTPKTAYTYKLQPKEQALYWSVETSKLYKDNAGRVHMNAYIAYDNDDDRIMWHPEVLGGTALTKQLEFVIARYIHNWFTANHELWETHVFKAPTVNVDKHFIRQMGPKRKRAQVSMVYRGIPMKQPDDTDVKPRMPIIHTNLDKCKINAPTHESYASPYNWEYGSIPKYSGNIDWKK